MSKHGYTADLADDLLEVGETIADRMREQIQNGHVRSGNLLRSIRCEVDHDDDGATVYIYADAKANNGAEYAEFLEHGTGEFNDTGPTDWPHGMHPIHFISNSLSGKDGLGPPVEKLIQDMIQDDIINFLDAEIKMELNTLKYKR